MSYSISYIGTRPAVAAKIKEDAKNGNIPEGIVKHVVQACEDIGHGSTNGIRVEGHGHIGGGSTNCGQLLIEPVDLLGVPGILVLPARSS